MRHSLIIAGLSVAANSCTRPPPSAAAINTAIAQTQDAQRASAAQTEEAELALAPPDSVVQINVASWANPRVVRRVHCTEISPPASARGVDDAWLLEVEFDNGFDGKLTGGSSVEVELYVRSGELWEFGPNFSLIFPVDKCP